MDRIKVLLVEDESTLAMIIKDTLEAQNFTITVAENGEEGLQALRRERPDVIVADVMMPKIDGFEMIRRVRKTDRLIPVLFLTARSAVNDVVEGFETGADDYLKKPFGMQELIVRIRALAGRAAQYGRAVRSETAEEYTLGKYTLNVVRQELSIANDIKMLSHRETEILRMLIEERNNVVKTTDILLELWGDDTFFNSRSLQVFITKLRHKLAQDENIKIINVRAVGYKLIYG
ncbi:MAG: response regulator transcription factor [Prevotella sp.]|uniref:response regulator transcription factor n=1 Tax=Prevotella sp. TaxID=59823 RepID=UPI002A2BF3EE|nr:response regulator transcription factor [Prevotella sp.]MDD7317798.1 response regulator transcription factor [Prevotellaceae bacterium]MDY4020713.1 response regulator transcription factor [Prevotella sp.]